MHSDAIALIHNTEVALENIRQEIREMDEVAADAMEDNYGSIEWETYERNREVALEIRDELEIQLDLLTSLY